MNKYINTSVQKAGIPGFPGCLEHAQMIWNSLMSAKRERKELHVVWLDLANAYGSVPHTSIKLALEFFHVPEKVIDVLMEYFGSAFMRFTTNDYTTDWQAPEIGIIFYHVHGAHPMRNSRYCHGRRNKQRMHTTTIKGIHG